MHFHLPRRHRRPLLFPPGLLALAGLLWLGCLVLSRWQKSLKPRYALQLTMPVLRPVDYLPDTPTVRWYLPTVAEAQVMRPWQDAFFTGVHTTDAIEQRRVATLAQAIATDTLQANGIRVRFAQKSHYEQFIFLLNLMKKEGLRKYWVDFYHSPTTFYVLTDAYAPASASDIIPIVCTYSLYRAPLVPAPVSLWTQIKTWTADLWTFNRLHPFLQPEWRVSVWVLGVILTLNGWRLVMNWRAA